MLDTIKEYLVSLGFDVDTKSYAKFLNTMGNSKASVSDFAEKTVKSFVKSNAAVLTFVASANIAIGSFIGSLAKADLENSKLAKSLWTTKNNAMDYNNTMKAMGVSLQDLFMSPELAGYFQKLQGQARGMHAPDELNQQLKFIRSIQFEFTRMKLESTYALQWIGYYFIKYMDGPIKNIKTSLSGINDIITKTMPSWTKTIAQVISWFAKMGIDTVRAIGDIKNALDNIKIPDSVKKVGAVLGGLALIFSAGPVATFAATLGGVLLLLDDYYTYLDKGHSKYEKFWSKSDETFKKVKSGIGNIKDELVSFYWRLEDDGSIKNFEDTFQNSKNIVVKLFKIMKDVVIDFYKSLGNDGGFSHFLDRIESLIKGVSDFTSGLTKLMDRILGKDGFVTALKIAGGIILDHMTAPIRGLLNLIDELGKGLSTIGKFMKGDFKGSWDSFKSMFTSNYVQPGSSSTSNKKVSISQTNNIYGSDPKLTANAANKNLDTLYRNVRGAY